MQKGELPGQPFQVTILTDLVKKCHECKRTFAARLRIVPNRRYSKKTGQEGVYRHRWEEEAKHTAAEHVLSSEFRLCVKEQLLPLDRTFTHCGARGSWGQTDSAAEIIRRTLWVSFIVSLKGQR